MIACLPCGPRARVQAKTSDKVATIANAKGAAEDPESDKHKRDSLENQRQGHGFWKPELASDSEEAVRADREKASTPAELAERTKKTAEETRKHGTSMSDGL